MDQVKMDGVKLVIFDLDGTLVASKQKMDSEMAGLLARLLETHMVAVISGATLSQFKVQFLSRFKANPTLLPRLFLFPTNSTAMYRYERGWKKAYEEKLFTAVEVKKIRSAFARAFRKIQYIRPKHIWGQVIENRGTQVTFSAPGQRAPLKVKERWHVMQDVRQVIARALHGYLKGFEIHLAGLTSIDVTRKDIDKAYGIRKILHELDIKKSEALFVGDALYLGGNDAPAKKTGVRCVQVVGPKETKKLIQKILNTRE